MRPRRCGSSPLARGLRLGELRDRADLRIIPARAGFTPRRPPGGSPGRDHPPSRGVYAQTARYAVSHLGSSPLARGLRGPRRRAHQGGRIIPARAGFTTRWRRSSRTRSDHPRSRGVYVPTRYYSDAGAGSSPLARGLLTDRDGQLVPLRIIPARAGFTHASILTGAPGMDHPRSRGVYGRRLTV